ncbi:MAG: oligoribonuclease [Ferrimicrobium sp.]
MLAWIDLEMTGLDPNRHVILEIATVITDDNLTIVAEAEPLVIHATEELLAAMDPVVVAMHNGNGLLNDVRRSTTTLEEASAVTLAFLKTHLPNPGQVPLCGNSIGTDRRFLDRYMPAVENWLHYRSVDVSSIKELGRRWYPTLVTKTPHKATAHRALDDIRESIQELQYYRDNLFIAPHKDSASPEGS